MCGIAGYIGAEPISEHKLDLCGQLMRRRGPDNFDIYHRNTATDRHVYLLHSRLNILDLTSSANQPFREGGHILTFNGEIYNFIELKQDLLKEGHHFRTTSDTEVLIKILGRDGVHGLKWCEGMWSLAFYDEQTDRLILSRDRFGEKPLYILRRNGDLYFGSEPKMIFALLGYQLPIDYSQLYRSLVYGSRVRFKENKSFFLDLETFPSGSVLEVCDFGRGKPSRYWSPRFDQEADMTFEEAVRGTRERLIRAVDIRLRADVPIAFCMSSGVDSNALISIAKRECGYNIRGYTFGSFDRRYDELEATRKIAADLDIDHTTVSPDGGNFLPDLKELIKYHDAPISTITWFANWLLMKKIAENGYKVSISGVGADELFSGYYDHHLAFLHEIKTDQVFHKESLENWEKMILPAIRNPYLRNPELFGSDKDFRGYLFMESRNYPSYLCSEWREEFKERDYTSSLLRNRMANEVLHENVPVYLNEEDFNAMYYSIENRSPYLDRTLFEFANKIPTKHLIRRGHAKAVLRESMRGIVPDDVLDNPIKTGFNAPISSFLDHTDPKIRNYLLGDGPIFQHIRRDRFQELLNKRQFTNSESKFIFSIINAKIFLENYEGL